MKKKQTAGAKAKESRLFLTKGELAAHFGCHMHSIDRWIVKGRIPPPHSRPGPGHAVWLRRHFMEYVETGEWPRDAYVVIAARA